MVCNETSRLGSIDLGINIRPDRVVLVALFLLFWAKYAASGKKVAWIREEKIMIAFFLILLLSCVVGGAIFASNNRYISKLISFSLIPGLLFMIARRLDFDGRALRAMRTFFVIVAAYLAFTAVMEHLHVSALVFPKYILDSSVGIHFGRVRGPFVQAVVMGGAMTVIGLWILWYHFNVQKSFLTWVLFFPLMAGCYWTDTRGAWLQVAVSLMVLAILRNPLRKPVRILFVLALAVYFSGVASKFSAYQTNLFNRRQLQVDDRVNIFHASWEMFLEKPVLGFGYGNFLKDSPAYFVQLEGVQLRGMGEGQHNTLLGLLSETGLAGTIPFCLIYFLFFKKLWQRYKEAGRDGDELNRSLALMTLAMLSGIVMSAQVSDFGFYNYINNLAFWLTGMVYSSLPALAAEPAGESAESPAQILSPAA
jgi:O-antigen ligase